MTDHEAFRLLDQRAANIFAVPYTDLRLKQGLTAYDEYKRVFPDSDTEMRQFAERLILNKAGTFIEKLESHAETVTSISQSIKASFDTFESLRSKAKEALATIKPAAEEIAKQLEIQSQGAVAQNTAQQFAKCFVIDPLDRDILQAIDHPIDEDFYRSLENVRTVKLNCGQYLASENGAEPHHLTKESQTLLASVLENLRISTAKSLLECELADIRPNAALRKQLSQLNMQPYMLKATLSAVIEQRKSRLAREFTETVTSSGGTRDASVPINHGNQTRDTRKPSSSNQLEFFAYDPPRFLGMLMAWLHSATVEEIDHFQLTVDSSINGHDDAAVLEKVLPVADTKETILELVDMVLSSLDLPLRQRASQLASGQSDIPQILNLVCIVEFYISQLSKFQLPNLQATLAKVVQAFDQQFNRCLAVEIDLTRAALMSVNLPDTPESWREVMINVRAILSSFVNSVGFSTPGVKDSMLARISTYLARFEQLCVECGSKLEPRENSRVFILNCLDEEQLTLATHSFMADRLQELQSQVDDLAQQLAFIIFEDMKRASGITDLGNDGSGTLDAAQFDKFLAEGSVGENKTLLHLSSPSIATLVETQARDLFIAACEAHASSLPRTVQEISLIL